MDPLGPIVRLQVQRASLKIGTPPHRRYDPAALLTVPAIEVSAAGAVGLTDRGERVTDVHHRAHPASKNRGENGISIGFSSHYDAMREALDRDRLAEGSAGENMLVASERRWDEKSLAGGLLIETADGDQLRLDAVVVAVPCVEFARYALRFPDEARPDRTVTAALAFLNDGIRGYYATYAGPPAVVRLGDRVYRAG